MFVQKLEPTKQTISNKCFLSFQFFMKILKLKACIE